MAKSLTRFLLAAVLFIAALVVDFTSRSYTIPGIFYVENGLRLAAALAALSSLLAFRKPQDQPLKSSEGA
jgi:hypothetical protein